jgi:hypothetical protein
LDDEEYPSDGGVAGSGSGDEHNDDGWVSAAGSQNQNSYIAGVHESLP